MIDEEGYRKNVGIIIINDEDQLVWAKRSGQKNAWQFPQGGIDEGEISEQALYRELKEELGLSPDDIEVIAETPGWLSYEIPKAFRRYRDKPLCIGQKQKWFLCRLISDENHIRLDYSDQPEFNQWRWVDYWYPLDHVIDFKRAVYESALKEFSSFLKE